MLTWSPLHSALAAYCFVEEALEASLSRLVRSAGSGLTTKNALEYSQKYVCLGRALHSDPTVPGIARPYPHRVAYRLERLIDDISNASPPYVPPPSKNQSKTRPRSTWPSSATRPYGFLY